MLPSQKLLGANMDEDLDYYLKYVKPAEFGSEYYTNPKYFDSDTKQYVAYKDTRGFLTFGPGVLVDNSLLKKLGKKTIKEGDKVDQSLIDTESENRWQQAVKEAKKLRGDTPSRLPIGEMIYQMGLPSVLKFKETLAQTDPKLAQQKALESNWAEQTPKRAREVTGRLKDAMELEQPEPKPRPQLASDIVEATAVPAESGGISDLVSQVGSSLGFDRGSPRSTLAPSGLSEQEDARFNLLLQNLTGK
jgi:hypothetical protein